MNNEVLLPFRCHNFAKSGLLRLYSRESASAKLFPLKPSPLVSRKKTHFLIGFCSRNPDNPANPQRPQIFCSQNVAAKNTVFLVQVVPIIPESACTPKIGEYVGIMKNSGFRTLGTHLKNGDL